MKVEPTGVVFVGECEIQGAACTARTPRPVTAVWTTPARTQVNVCRACLEEMVRAGEWEVEGARLRPTADVAVVSRDGTPLLVVEVRRRPSVVRDPRAWAVRVHRNLLAHNAIQASRLFMLAAVPGPFYVWRTRSEANADALPDAVVHPDPDTGKALQSLHEQDAPPQEVERVVAQWLAESLQGRRDNAWLSALGVNGLAADTRVIREYAA